MLAGTVKFYDNFLIVRVEMDIEDFDSLSLREKFDLILEEDIVEVVIERVIVIIHNQSQVKRFSFLRDEIFYRVLNLLIRQSFTNKMA